VEANIFDLGDHVECDLCSKDFTDSDAVGGFLFSGNGVCPECSKVCLEDIEKYHEEKYIRAVADPDETFRDFILRVRNGNNLVTIIELG
jgi:hypothetical protein